MSSTLAAPAPRAPFLTACPVCGTSDRREVVSFPELVFSRCDGCSLVYKSESVPSLGVGYEEEYFRFNRAKYLARWEHRVRKCGRQLLDALQVAPHARDACDVGCSAGYVLEAAKRLGLSPVGVDVSRFAVDLCRERGYRAELGPLEALPLPDGSMDIVTAKHTLEHVKEPLPALRELYRVLRPGGALLLVVPDGHYWKLEHLTRAGRSFRPDRRGWQHHVYFEEHHLVDVAARVGFEVAVRGKAVRRRRESGLAALVEPLRYGWLALYTAIGKATRLRREFQVVFLKPGGPLLKASSHGEPQQSAGEE